MNGDRWGIGALVFTVAFCAVVVAHLHHARQARSRHRVIGPSTMILRYVVLFLYTFTLCAGMGWAAYTVGQR